MADENKFADEMLIDEQLDSVAGGNCRHTSDDSKFLYEYGLVDDWHGRTSTMFHWKSYSAEVDGGWSKAGITCVTKFASNNKYFMGGREITHDEAVAHVRANFKKIRDCDD